MMGNKIIQLVAPVKLSNLSGDFFHVHGAIYLVINAFPTGGHFPINMFQKKITNEFPVMHSYYNSVHTLILKK